MPIKSYVINAIREKQKLSEVPKIHNVQMFQIFITFSPCSVVHIVSDSKLFDDCNIGMIGKR